MSAAVILFSGGLDSTALLLARDPEDAIPLFVNYGQPHLAMEQGAAEAIAVNTVKDRMIEKSPNTTRLMDKLIAKNLISRERCASDGRVIYVKITASGLELLKTIDAALKEQENILVPPITDEDADQLSELLDKIRNASRG